MASAGDNAENIKTEVLEKWLAGEGKEVSWKTLADVLDTMKLRVLADDIRTSHQTEG